jgi:2-amino-4-hydroxy-6-hydroxymethyldihydropteridine diphosphokinase
MTTPRRPAAPAHNAFVALGANLGARKTQLKRALTKLRAHPGIRVLKVSSFVETTAVGGPAGQPDFLNAVAQISTTLRPASLLRALLSIEAGLGRKRKRGERNAPRTMDLDLLTYDDLILKQRGLQLPHPRMHQRRFVLDPLAEIAPDVQHPVLKKSFRALRNALR